MPSPWAGADRARRAWGPAAPVADADNEVLAAFGEAAGRMVGYMLGKLSDRATAQVRKAMDAGAFLTLRMDLSKTESLGTRLVLTGLDGRSDAIVEIEQLG